MNEELSEQEMLRRLKAEEIVPEPPPDLSARVWLEISPRLLPYSKSERAWRCWLWTKPLIILAAAAVLLLSFLGGRIWERTHQPAGVGLRSNALARSTAERILLTAAADHLERSQRFLIELQMSRGASPELSRTAQELLDDNRLYRQSAVYANDAALADVLDRLGRVLAEVAHTDQGEAGPPGLAQGDWRLKDLLRAIRIEQRRSPGRV